MPFYQRAGDYRSASTDKLPRRVYLVLGEWQSATGKTASFTMDGQCDLMGEKLYYRVSNFSLFTGTDPENMTITHKLSAIDEKGMSLRDIRDGEDVVYKYSRVGDFALPEMEVSWPVDTTPEKPEEPEAPEGAAEPAAEEDDAAQA